MARLLEVFERITTIKRENFPIISTISSLKSSAKWVIREKYP
jgi:hypothetical protein